MTPNLNGDDPKKMLEDRMKFLRAAVEINRLKAEIYPHGRNYLDGGNQLYVDIDIHAGFSEALHNLNTLVHEECEILQNYIDTKERK